MHITHTLSTVLRRVALAVALAASSSLASAAVIHVDVDTSNFGVATGYIDMQFGSSQAPGIPLETALVTNMVGFDPSAFIDSWGLTQVAGGYLFRNDTENDLFHAVNFGGLLSFDLSFAGAIDPLSLMASHFTVSAFNEAFAPLGNYDPDRGSLADFVWTPAISAAVDGTIGVSITDDAVTFVPEPADSLLMGAGLGLMALVLRRRARSAGLVVGRAA